MICTTSLVSQWEQELQRRVKNGILKVHFHNDRTRNRVKQAEELARYDLVFTTHTILANELGRNGVCFQVSNKKRN